MSDNFKNGENQMKTPLSKAISVILIAGLTAILTACSSQSFQSTADSSYATAVQTTASPETTSVTAGTSAAPEATAETKPDTSYAETSTSAKTETTVTTTVSTTASTPATTAEPAWKETRQSAEMYLNTSVYSRTRAYLGAPTADLYQINDKVKVVAVTDTDYYKLDNGRFIHRDYLSDEKTVIQTTVQATTITTAPPATTAPIATTAKEDNRKPVTTSGKYVSSGYAPLDEKIHTILDRIITKNMNDEQKLKAVYDYLMQSSYFERTLLIPNDKKQYSQQLYACFILDNNYGVCYDFTSAFKYMTQALGFETRMIYGYHTNPGGGAGEHSWAEIDIKGTTYIFDPAIEKILISEGYSGSSRFMRTYDEIGKYYILD